MSRIGEKSEGYSGADMANLCKEAAMGPIRSLDYSKIDLIRVLEFFCMKYFTMSETIVQISE